LPSLPTSVGALEVKTTKRPSALTAGSRLDPMTSVPPVASETRVVVGVQAGVKGAPMQVSRRKMSAKPLVSFPAPMRFVAKDMKAKSVAIIDDRTAYGQGVADEVEKAAKAGGAQIVAREFTTDKATDFKAILTKIKGRNPDVIFYGGMDATGGPMAKQARDLGVKSKFVMADGGCSPEFIKLAGDAAEGFICSIPGTPVDKLSKGEEFKKRYKDKFGSDVQIYSPNAYDATMVLVEAMKRANSADPAKFLPELGKTSYEGVTGKIEFDDKGDLRSGAITIYEAKGGKLDVLTTVGG